MDTPPLPCLHGDPPAAHNSKQDRFSEAILLARYRFRLALGHGFLDAPQPDEIIRCCSDT